MDQFITKMRKCSIELIVCLTTEDEIRYKSEEYYKMRTRKQLPCSMKDFPIKDYSVPCEEEKERFKTFIHELSELLLKGTSMLIHCKMGIGRTGTVVVCILQKLGIPLTEAIEITKKAEAYPMVQEQRDLVAWYCSEIRDDSGKL